MRKKLALWKSITAFFTSTHCYMALFAGKFNILSVLHTTKQKNCLLKGSLCSGNSFLFDLTYTIQQITFSEGKFCSYLFAAFFLWKPLSITSLPSPSSPSQYPHWSHPHFTSTDSCFPVNLCDCIFVVITSSACSMISVCLTCASHVW